mmetsp:Transcript_107718/g.311198  ORF Transcript_107718/g.311198 Transcript_107718/m.311198 type:complete len:492 (-) Transcript_107718:67-1542(-)
MLGLNHGSSSATLHTRATNKRRAEDFFPIFESMSSGSSHGSYGSVGTGDVFTRGRRTTRCQERISRDSEDQQAVGAWHEDVGSASPGRRGRMTTRSRERLSTDSEERVTEARMSVTSYPFETYSDAPASLSNRGTEIFDEANPRHASDMLATLVADVDEYMMLPRDTNRSDTDLDEAWQLWLEERRRARRALSGTSSSSKSSNMSMNALDDESVRLTRNSSSSRSSRGGVQADVASDISDHDDLLPSATSRRRSDSDSDVSVLFEVRPWRTAGPVLDGRGMQAEAEPEAASSSCSPPSRPTTRSSERASSVDTGSMHYKMSWNTSELASIGGVQGNEPPAVAGAARDRRNFLSAPAALIATVVRVCSGRATTGRRAEARVLPSETDDRDEDIAPAHLEQTPQDDGRLQHQGFAGSEGLGSSPWSSRVRARAMVSMLPGRLRGGARRDANYHSVGEAETNVGSTSSDNNVLSVIPGASQRSDGRRGRSAWEF